MGQHGLHAVSCSMGEDVSTVEDVIEPFLLRQEYIARTKQGRILTAKGMQYILDKIRSK